MKNSPKDGTSVGFKFYIFRNTNLYVSSGPFKLTLYNKMWCLELWYRILQNTLQFIPMVEDRSSKCACRSNEKIDFISTKH